MMLLRLRAAVCNEDDDDDCEVRYGTRTASELPPPSSKAKATRARATSALSTDSWRATSQETSLANDSWRQSLPEATQESWVAQQRKRSSADTQNDDETVLRALRSILNKLTVEKF